MIGFKEWIFSHKSGALGSFAAAAEVRGAFDCQKGIVKSGRTT